MADLFFGSGYVARQRTRRSIEWLLTRLPDRFSGPGPRSPLGHEHQFPLPRLSAGFGFRKETIAGMHRNGRDAPIPAVRGTEIERQGSTLSEHSVRRMNRAAFNAFLALGSRNWGLSLPPISSAATPQHLRAPILHRPIPHQRLRLMRLALRLLAAPQLPPRLIETQRHTSFGDYDRQCIGVGRGYCRHHRGVNDAQSCETANARVTPERFRVLGSFHAWAKPPIAGQCSAGWRRRARPPHRERLSVSPSVCAIPASRCGSVRLRSKTRREIVQACRRQVVAVV